MSAAPELSLTNNATSTLATGIDTAATEIAINGVDAASFPNLPGGSWCPLTIIDAEGNFEIVKATKRNGGIFTVVRGQENTQARMFNVGSRVDLRLTAAAINEIANKPVTDARLPEHLQPRSANVPGGDANRISVTGIYTCVVATKNAPLNEKGLLHHAETGTEACQDWTAFAGYRRYLRTRQGDNWSAWREITIQPEVMEPWALYPLGVPVPVMPELANAQPAVDSKLYRYVKLTASDAYNKGVLVSEVVEGSAPSLWSAAKINYPVSPFHGKTIRLTNTERRFIRAGSPGTLEESQNLWHNHNGQTSADGNHQHDYSRLVFANRGPAGFSNRPWLVEVGYQTNWAGTHQHNFTTNPSGGNEARPRNMGMDFYVRIK